ncbi:hypothetical protein ABT039_34240 [Streptomyces lasiicapitis]|uniref:Uncharacterized protein n=1 Tax=Streptomyces lasiicapitis TaxID=1923961 RepID=A0ABQ2MFH8_9ACTN|nr:MULTISPECIES: hypothetical protein [Streptomyces]GGO50804.1 hypothetical protein GCM10012286_52010 [Streptomyces lasiicapitis]
MTTPTGPRTALAPAAPGDVRTAPDDTGPAPEHVRPTDRTKEPKP